MCGATREQFLKMDYRCYNDMLEGYIDAREQRINDGLNVGHRVARKISEAVWSNKDYNKPIEHIRLRGKTIFDKQAECSNELGIRREDAINRLRKELSRKCQITQQQETAKASKKP